MSAIAGLYNLNKQPVEQDHLQQMSDAMAHRGPDQNCVWLEGAVGLAHRMLWTTRESLLEQMPLLSQDQSLVLVADARIDNREELIASLSLSDRPAEKITDSDLILAAYQQWGEDCVHHLLGDFAFALWDATRNALFCARDHFGVKPFYYFYQPEQVFCFASEMKALFCLPSVPHVINESRIANHLTMMLHDQATTCYQKIFRLPPAHTLTVGAALGARLQRYWKLDATREIHLNSDEEYALAFRDIFAEAVRCRLRSAFPIGSHLSGGLDSTSVTCMARHLLQSKEQPLHVFSNVYNVVTECDEREYIQPVLEQGSLIPHEVYPDQTGPLSNWQDLLQPLEEPCLIGGNGYLIWNLNQASQQAGVRVSLDGFDGDTTVSHGFNLFAELAKAGHWRDFADNAVALSERLNTSPAAILQRYGFAHLVDLAWKWHWISFVKAIAGMQQVFTISPRVLWIQCGLKPIVPQFVMNLWHWLKGQQGSSQTFSKVINSEFAQRVGCDRQPTVQAPAAEHLRSVREQQYQDLTSGGFTFVLELQDIAAAACSLEARHPFMDKRLIEFCLALPSHQKLKHGWTRMIMRRAMEGLLPEKVQWRSGKMDVTPGFLHGLLNINRELVEDVVLNDAGSIKAYVDLNHLRGAYDRLTSSAPALDDDVRTVWAATALALWLRQTGFTATVNPT
ncbi:lasso peptide isopeptide bond-forming cyclase [Leptolyngbya sp. AN02str]|uniref:lasso peptide isopeptide bond-forming cyclase n=1 Tax=Leptolyngbya sp. AN02str TaxID=3423363 RepID=UPI003D322943